MPRRCWKPFAHFRRNDSTLFTLIPGDTRQLETTMFKGALLWLIGIPIPIIILILLLF